MKVLFFLCGSFDRRTPSEHLLTAMIETLYSKGHTVHIIQKNTGGSMPHLPIVLKNLGVTTAAVPCSTPKKRNFIARYLADLSYVRACRKHISKKDGYSAAFVQSTNVAGAVISLLRKKLGNISITFNVQDVFPYNAVFSGNLSKGGIPFKVLSACQRSGYNKADKIITISEDMADLLVLDGVDRNKISVVYNWSYGDAPYNASQLDMTETKKMFFEDKFNVVYAGNIGIMQNVDLVIEAAVLLKDERDVYFHVIGDGAYKNKLESKVNELGIANVKFWDMLGSAHAPSIYASASVNVIPLVKDVYKTALPSKTATCFAAGSPIILCIGTESKFAQMAKRETGCLCVESDDAEGLKNAILSVRQGHDTKRYGEFFVSKLGKKQNSEKYVEIITQPTSVIRD